MKDILITGVSGSGKTSVQLQLIEKYGYTMLYNFSTRPIRGEDGVDVYGDFTNKERDNYIFISPEDLLKKYKSGDCSNITLYNGNLYAMSKVPMKANAPVVAILEPTGRKQVEKLWKEEGRNYVTLFFNISPEEQEKRLVARDGVNVRNKDFEYFAPEANDVVIYCNNKSVEEIVEEIIKLNS